MLFKVIIEEATEADIKRLFGDNTRLAQKVIVEAKEPIEDKMQAAQEASEKLEQIKEEAKKPSTRTFKKPAKPAKKEEPKSVDDEIDETFEKEDPVDKVVKGMKEASEDDDLGLGADEESEASEPVNTKDDLIKLVIKKRDAGKDIKSVIRGQLKLGKISEIKDEDVDKAYAMFEAL